MRDNKFKTNHHDAQVREPCSEYVLRKNLLQRHIMGINFHPFRLHKVFPLVIIQQQSQTVFNYFIAENPLEN